jgi:hypothetical protein
MHALLTCLSAKLWDQPPAGLWIVWIVIVKYPQDGLDTAAHLRDKPTSKFCAIRPSCSNHRQCDQSLPNQCLSGSA